MIQDGLARYYLPGLRTTPAAGHRLLVQSPSAVGRSHEGP